MNNDQVYLMDNAAMLSAVIINTGYKSVYGQDYLIWHSVLVLASADWVPTMWQQHKQRCNSQDNIFIGMKKEQAKEYFQQLKKVGKAKHMALAEVINIITAGAISLRKAQLFIDQNSTNQFGNYNHIYEYLQLPDWRSLEFEQIYVIVKCLRDELKKGRTLTQVKESSEIDIKQMGTLFDSKLQNNTLELIVSQLDQQPDSDHGEPSEQSAYQQKSQQAKFKVIKKLLIIFDFIRKSMRKEGQTFELNQNICERLDLTMFMRYVKMFELGSIFRMERIIRSFKATALNQLWLDFDRFVNANLQMIGFRQNNPSKEKYLRLKGLVDLLSAEKIKKMLNIRNRAAVASIVEGHTGTYKQDVLYYLKQKHEQRKHKLDQKWKGKRLNTEGVESRVMSAQRANFDGIAKNQSTKSLPKRTKTQPLSIYDELKLPKLRLKDSREQSIYKSLKQLNLKTEQSMVRQLVNAQQEQSYLGEYLRKEQVRKERVEKKVKKLVELPPMKFT